MKGPKHNAKASAYLQDVLRITADLKGGVHHVEVKHESHCDQLNGRGNCNCKPDVRMVRPS